MAYTQEEDLDVPEGLLPDRDPTIPENFSFDEWVEISKGFESRLDEVSQILALRGQEVKRGRPTNFTVDSKRELSTTAHAIAQRQRAALRSEEERALAKAKDADRAAKKYLGKRIRKDFPEYDPNIPYEGQPRKVRDMYEALAEKRFRQKSSAEWLENALMNAHKRWDDIEQEIDLRAHQLTLDEADRAPAKKVKRPKQGKGLNSAGRLFGSGGVLEKIMRQEYESGLEKLQSKGFESKAEKEEWQRFCKKLSANDLEVVRNDNWEPRHPEHIEETGKYVLNPDYEVEVEDMDEEEFELEEYLSGLPDDYGLDGELSEEDESEEEKPKVDGTGEAAVIEDEDSESETEEASDFEGFSD
ncbi:hypothetical protein HBI18_252410 [Parastagonospora nodorum]|nr:hypothetical protein HBI18_252410 [Parastagonospora nodorum]